MSLVTKRITFARSMAALPVCLIIVAGVASAEQAPPAPDPVMQATDTVSMELTSGIAMLRGQIAAGRRESRQLADDNARLTAELEKLRHNGGAPEPSAPSPAGPPSGDTRSSAPAPAPPGTKDLATTGVTPK